MKTKAATFLCILAMAAPAMAAQSWTLILGGRTYCGSVNFDSGGKPVKFITDRGLSIAIANYPSLISKSTLYPHCSRISLDSAVSDVAASSEERDPEQEKKDAEQAKRKAEEEKRIEKKEIDEALARHCKSHGNEAGCQE